MKIIKTLLTTVTLLMFGNLAFATGGPIKIKNSTATGSGTDHMEYCLNANDAHITVVFENSGSTPVVITNVESISPNYITVQNFIDGSNGFVSAGQTIVFQITFLNSWTNIDVLADDNFVYIPILVHYMSPAIQGGESTIEPAISTNSFSARWDICGLGDGDDDDEGIFDSRIDDESSESDLGFRNEAPDFGKVDKTRISNLVLISNPVYDQLFYSYELDQDAEVSVSLFNLMGVEIRQFEPRIKRKPGTYQKNEFVDDLQPGVYYLCMNVNGKLKTKKVIKQ